MTGEKRDLPYALVDIDDTYDGERVSTNARFNVHFPALMKYDDPDLPEAGSNVGSKDVIVMRLAEMYLIAAEAETLMGGGNKTLASDLDIDFILEERGRELCGEHIRWFDLKRTGKLYNYVQAYNKDITTMQPYHVNRPIPQQFLDVITNPLEFGQNNGY